MSVSTGKRASLYLVWVFRVQLRFVGYATRVPQGLNLAIRGESVFLGLLHRFLEERKCRAVSGDGYRARFLYFVYSYGICNGGYTDAFFGGALAGGAVFCNGSSDG